MASVKRYTTENAERRIEVEFDASLVFLNRLRLFVDGRRADERSIFWAPPACTPTHPMAGAR